MRKAGKKEEEIYFEMWGLKEIDKVLTSIAMSPKYYDFEDNMSKDETKNKLVFKANSNHENPSSRGFYVINSVDKAIEEFYLIEDRSSVPFEERRGVKYRTVYYEINVYFGKDEEKNLYFLDKAKVNATVELYDLDKPTGPIMYEAKYVWYGLNRVDKAVKQNVSVGKDVFKLDFPYDESFWKNQNLLMLTEEMQHFIEGLSNTDSKNQFKYISNIDNRQ